MACGNITLAAGTFVLAPKEWFKDKGEKNFAGISGRKPLPWGKNSIVKTAPVKSTHAK